jgi:hypothetical protein
VADRYYDAPPPPILLRFLALLVGLALVEALRYLMHQETFRGYAGSWPLLISSSAAINVATHLYLGIPAHLPRCIVSAAFNQFGMPYTVYVLGSAILRAAEVLWQVLQQVARDLIPGLPR